MGHDSKTESRKTGPGHFSIRFNLGLGLLSALAIVLMLNFLASRHVRTITLSPDRFYPLSPVTLQIIGTVTNNVRMIVFFDPEEPLYTHIEAVLSQYQKKNRHLKLELIDYVREPAKAEQIKSQFQLDASARDVVIFESQKRARIVRSGDLSEYDIDPLITGRSTTVQRKNFNGEAFFTTAILSVTTEKRQKIYFTEGHKEHSPSDASADVGYHKLAMLIQNHNADVAVMSLSKVEDIPEDCDLVIVAGPEYELTSDSLNILDRYLQRGGRMFLLFRHGSRTGLERLLHKWGVVVDDNLVVDRANSSSDNVVITGTYGGHEIVRPLVQANLPLAIAYPRVVRAVEKKTSSGAPEVTELVFSSANAIGIVDYRNGKRPNPLRDSRGSLPLMAVVEKGSVKGVRQGSTRIVVSGDSYLLDNQMLEIAGNRDFGWNAISWLLDQSQLLGVAPRPIREYRFVMTNRQMQTARWMFLVLFPGGLLAFGWMVWFKRQI